MGKPRHSLETPLFENAGVAAGAVVAIGPEREQRRRCDDAARLLSIRREARVSPRRAVRRLAVDHVPAPDELRAPVRPSSSGDCRLMGATRSTAATGRATGGGVAPVAIYAGSGSRSGRRPRPRCRVGRPAGLQAGASKWSSCVGTALHRQQRDLTSGRRPGRSRSREQVCREPRTRLARVAGFGPTACDQMTSTSSRFAALTIF